MLRHCLISQNLALVALGGSLALASCGSSSDGSGPPPSSGTSGGSAGAPVEAPTLRFFVDEAPEVSIVEQDLIPEELRVIGVQVTPPDAYRVRFSLVSLKGAPPHDGSLDRTDALTDPTTGIAHVRLRAPSSFTQFSLQASIGTMTSAELKVYVESQGWAELQVIPEYEGQRQVTEWVANAYLKVRCSEVAQVTELDRGLPADAQYSAKSVFGIPPRFEVPVQPNMAITLRAGHYLFGCTNLEQPLINELSSVTVKLANVPIQLKDVSLDVQLGVQETTRAWLDHLETAAEDVMLAFTGETENDVKLVLDTMASLLDPGDRQAFQTAAAAGEWETRALSSLANMDARALRNALAGWLSAGSNTLSADTAFAGTLRSSSSADGTAELQLEEVAGVDAERAGFEPTLTATWSADPNDTVALGATLRWSTSAFVAALGEAKATEEHAEADDLSDAFADLIDCQLLTESLTGAESESFVFASCDSACTEALCLDALDALEQQLWAASDDEQELKLSATGLALVDDEAHAVSFTGTWRGTFPMGESAAVGGDISGTKTEDTAQ